MLGGQQLDLMPQRLQRSGPMVRTTTGLHRNERLLTIDKVCGYSITLELVPGELACRGIHDVELEHVLGNIHSNDW